MEDYGITNAANPMQYIVTRNRPLRLLLKGAEDSNGRALLPQRIIGNETLCGGFEFRMLCISKSAILPLKDFIGVPAELQVVTDRVQLRRICGIVMEAASGQSDGGLATYQLIMRDALSVLERCLSGLTWLPTGFESASRAAPGPSRKV